MTSRFRHNATFAIALILLSIAVFFAIFWYLAMSTSVFQHSNTSTYRINVNNVNVNKTHGTTTPGPDLTPPPITTGVASPAFLDDCAILGERRPGLDNFSDPEVLRLNGITEFQCIKPVKLHIKSLHTDDLLYESKNNGSGHNQSTSNHFTGEFRKSNSLLWDPHPQYIIEAFGQNMRLDLYNDGSFIHKDLKITHAWPNETLRRKIDHEDHDQIRGCFYRGQVYADAASSVSVSLCDGMTGQIRTHQGTFMIRPVEKYADDKRSILHIIYRLESPSTGDYIDDILHNGHSSPGDTKRSILQDSNAIDVHDVRQISFDQPHAGSSLTDPHSFKMAFTENGHGKPRRKRSLHNNNNNNEYTMEILVAVDRKMQEYHGEETRNYVLTLMSIVSNIFADASIGNSISIAVVHIMFLKDNVAHDAKGVGVEASKMLTNFCRIKNEKYKHDHDTALLLTREQICRSPSETKCDTLGLAELGTICRKESCSLVQDNGLSAAFTIAHELGHILNMPHDDDQKCSQSSEEKKEHFIMSRMLGKNTHPWAWSNCSRYYATEYLENNHGSCMLNTPTHGVIEPNTGNSKLAGEKFNQHQQCELVYGQGSKICSYMPECSSLWCVTSGDKPDEGCRSQAMPWADGTPCGKTGSNMWCQKANCVPRNRDALRPVDGGWGGWSRWSECSLPCGGGVRSSTRQCDSPAPANSGKYCTGNRAKYESCNTENCPKNMADVRTQQCREYDNNNFMILNKSKNIKWVPKYGFPHVDECKLYCRLKDDSNYFLLKHKVKDGTPCSQGGFDKCVNGHCHQAGCDNVLYSAATLDKCGVCKGRNDTCEDVNGSMTRDKLLKRMMDSQPPSIYHQVTVIPEGALNIEIRQPGYPDDKSFIALRGEGGEDLLNAESSITNFPREFVYAGVIFKYNGANQSMETVSTTYAAPLHKRVFVDLLIVRTSKHDMEWLHGDQEIISYSYTIAKPQASGRASTTPVVLTAQNTFGNHHNYNSIKRHHHNFQWKLSEFVGCNKLCYGKRYRTAHCVNVHEGRQVDHNYCSAQSRPNDESEDCNTDCNLSWTLKTSNCSTTCGEGFKTNEHICIQKFNTGDRTNIVDDVYCPEIRNKILKEICFGTCPDALWEYGQWSTCSQSCGGGIQNRSAYCYSYPGGSSVDQIFCQRFDKDDVRSCNSEPCPEWTYDENTPCSVTCGEGYKSRALKCKQKDLLVNSSLCAHIPRPITTRPLPCTMPACAAKKVSPPQVLAVDDAKIRHRDVYNVHPNSLYPSYHPKHSSTPPPSIVNLKYDWKTGRWGNCSSCGVAGKRQRSVRCSKSTSNHDLQYVEDYLCDLEKRPVNITNCSDVGCRMWNFGQWSECSETCQSTRQVICRNETERLSESQCDPLTKPHDRKTCCHIKWRSVWTACSGKCGFGERVRKKVCMKLMPKSQSNPQPIKTGKQLDHRHCLGLPEPKYSILSRACRKSCSFFWKPMPWSKCDVGCGQGIARREVICTNGTTTSVSQKDCDQRKLKKSTVCESREHCVWKVKKWKTSQCKCDGYQKVRTVCMDDLRKRRSTYCIESERPPHKQRCTPNPPYCSCRDLRRRNIRWNGEYGMNVGGRNISIYCHDMHTDSPKEYLTLKAGDTENYALYLGNRSRHENKCPYEHSDTFIDKSVPAGTTRFKKLRVKLNLDSVQVIDDDYEFALTSGRNQAFATAGDCFSNTGDCPRGVFHINLDGTGLMISPQTEWIAEGQRASIHFHTPLEAPYLKVVGRCGGYCGKCRPSSPMLLDVV